MLLDLINRFLSLLEQRFFLHTLLVNSSILDGWLKAKSIQSLRVGFKLFLVNPQVLPGLISISWFVPNLAASNPALWWILHFLVGEHLNTANW